MSIITSPNPISTKTIKQVKNESILVQQIIWEDLVAEGRTGTKPRYWPRPPHLPYGVSLWVSLTTLPPIIYTVHMYNNNIYIYKHINANKQHKQ